MFQAGPLDMKILFTQYLRKAHYCLFKDLINTSEETYLKKIRKKFSKVWKKKSGQTGNSVTANQISGYSNTKIHTEKKEKHSLLFKA